MIGTCDFCGENNRKIKELTQHDIAIMAVCRYGCDSRRSIPSAVNRSKFFELCSVTLIIKSFEDSKWRVTIRDRRRIKSTFHLTRYAGETESGLTALIQKCKHPREITKLKRFVNYN